MDSVSDKCGKSTSLRETAEPFHSLPPLCLPQLRLFIKVAANPIEDSSHFLCGHFMDGLNM